MYLAGRKTRLYCLSMLDPIQERTSRQKIRQNCTLQKLLVWQPYEGEESFVARSKVEILIFAGSLDQEFAHGIARCLAM